MTTHFNKDGIYTKTDWKTGDKITADKLNKIEDAIYKIQTTQEPGGMILVANETERDKLTGIENGELCYVQSKDEYFKYKDGLWTIFSSGTGTGGMSTDVTLYSYIDENLNTTPNDDIELNMYFATTGNTKTGRMSVEVNGIFVKSEKVTEGDISVKVSNYLKKGSNTVEITVTDVYGSSNFIVYTINVIEMTLTSVFDHTQIFNDTINIIYTASGNIEKTLHVRVDNAEVLTETINTSGISKTCTIPAQSHGEHVVEMYVECSLNGVVVKSNTLKYHIICIEESGTTPIISSSFELTEADQYTVLSIPYMIYTPNSLTSNVELYINNQLYSSLSADRTLQKWNLSDYDSGELVLKIKTGNVFKEFTLTINEVILDVVDKTEGLELHLTSKNRINDANKQTWVYGNTTTEFRNFTWVNDGWHTDDEGYNALIIEHDARAVINFKPFATDFKGTGKTIEFEFEVKNVVDYDAVIISCMNGNRGIEIGCKKAIFKSNESEVVTKFKDDEKIRVAFSIESKNQNRLIYVYINGILSGLTQYVDTDVFSQSSPVNITMGSNDCKLYVYNVRVYNQSLSVSEALNNYIYDMNDIGKKMDLLAKNNVYDDYGEVSYNKLVNRIPCMIITGELPPVKGDKKTVDIQYTNKNDDTKNFTAKGISIDIQGTSSQYYPKKNYKIKLVDTYKLRENSVPGKVFCLKADYMESSHCHNTGMAKIVHGMYSEYVPTQTSSNGVRTTIDGFPIALFHRESENSPIQYFGIYNFNDDKDNTDTFGYVSGTECWEVCNNTSKRTLFQISDYETIGTDGNPEWYADFEARYPDKNRDYTNLKRLTDWIVSTDGDLDKFKNEFEQYFNLHYTLVYCVLTELFAMVDSRAKNMFLASWDKTIWYPVFYDMDTCFGLNNEGELVFEYDVETNDVIGTQNVYNGKNSLLWQNFENAFANEIKETYNSLRDSDKLTYEKVLSILEGQQINILSEAQYNEDAKYKYLDPLLNDNISTYLYIAQGSRINHLKYWLFNRFNYMDSKYIASDYKDNYATMRLYTPENWSGVRPNSNFTITPFANQYSTVKFGSYVISERSQADTPIEVVAPDIEFNDTETIIYGANRISSLGNLADKYAGTVDMSKATQLTELLIGSNASGYSNTNLKTVSVGNNKLLRKIDVRNCPSLTEPLDLSKCDNIQEVYATGTSITSVKFSNGTELTTLALPNTITSLILINKKKLTSITTEGYDNLNILRIENSAINPFVIINSSPVLESIRLIGINCQTNVTDIQYLSTLKGIDEDGVEIPIADAISGNITIVECSREILEGLKNIFPNVTFNVLTFTTSWNVTFVDGDGNVLYETKVLNNGEAIYLGDTPTKTSTAQYDYTWKGWDRQLKPVMSDCVINATFDSILRYYTVKFVNGDTLEVVQELVLGYGATITYPELPSGANTWTPLQTIVMGDITFTSKYIPYPDDLSIFSFHDTSINNQPGYICYLKELSSYPSLVIVPFHYNNKPVFVFQQSNTSSNTKYPYSDIKEVYLPETVEILSSYAFAKWGVSSIDLSNIKYISYLRVNANNTPPFDKTSSVSSLFYQCKSIKNVSLPKIQFLPATGSQGMFCYSTLEIITIGSEEYPFEEWRDYGSSLDSYKHFSNCSKLKIVNLVTKNGLESDVNFVHRPSSIVKPKIIYSKTPVELGTTDDGFEYVVIGNEVKIIGYTGTATEINLSTINGKNVTSIDSKAFYQNADITSVNAPNVTSLGDGCFGGCTSLASIVIPSVTSLGKQCFDNCTSLASIEIPNVTSLGAYCFYKCTSLVSILLPNVTSLGEYCFQSCTRLLSISLPEATSLGQQCFAGCTSLTSIELPKATSLGDNCFDNCYKLASIEIPNVTSLGAYCFYSCSKLTSISLPNATSLGNYCFNNCTSLTSIEIPNVTNLGSKCFYYCGTLTSISLPNATSLGDYCFNYCSKLASIEIPNVTNLGYSCFNNCTALTSIEIPNATSLDDYCFSDCTSLASIEAPKATSLGEYCFTGCNKLPSISLPNATSLGDYCFRNCYELASIEIPNVTNLGSRCFYYCSKLTSISLPNATSLGDNIFISTNVKMVTLGGYSKPIVDTSGFDTGAFNSNINSLIIYVQDPTNLPTLTGSPWAAINATIEYEQA